MPTLHRLHAELDDVNLNSPAEEHSSVQQQQQPFVLFDWISSEGFIPKASSATRSVSCKQRQECYAERFQNAAAIQGEKKANE